MRSRDENLALRSLTAAVEAHTGFLKVISGRIDEGFARLDAKLDGILEDLAGIKVDLATHDHGDES